MRFRLQPVDRSTTRGPTSSRTDPAEQAGAAAVSCEAGASAGTAPARQGRRRAPRKAVEVGIASRHRTNRRRRVQAGPRVGAGHAFPTAVPRRTADDRAVLLARPAPDRSSRYAVDRASSMPCSLRKPIDTSSRNSPPLSVSISRHGNGRARRGADPRRRSPRLLHAPAAVRSRSGLPVIAVGAGVRTKLPTIDDPQGATKCRRRRNPAPDPAVRPNVRTGTLPRTWSPRHDGAGAEATMLARQRIRRRRPGRPRRSRNAADRRIRGAPDRNRRLGVAGGRRSACAVSSGVGFRCRPRGGT